MIFVEMEYDMNYNKKDTEILAGIWDKNGGGSMKCPQCGGKMVLIQMEPVHNTENPYIPYDTIIECTSCSFNVRVTCVFVCIFIWIPMSIHWLFICTTLFAL